MRNWLGRIALTATMTFGLAASPAAAAVATYAFEDLTGTGRIGTLVLNDYTPGSESGTLVSWRFVTPFGLDEVNAADLVLFSSDLAFTYVGEEGLGNVVTIASPTFTFKTGLVDPDGGGALLWKNGCPLFASAGVICGGGDGPNVESNPPATYSWRLLSLASSGPDAGVPEPMTWTLMIAGLGLAGARLRARRRSLA